ncbi:HD domain-containing phosphohydrolase [Methylobacterium sp. AMS5]|uniref:HD-GYP domain-containing protein n=1 Tax=Methylobacterium sp. AMS5 TaxID=925818 RepID=UPI00074F863B|nr:HD domain-containing phosphohydrolase [Methylobacterium sp. AMS5]AMB44366.1 phosphohydrolase [Methylobacterium sp. AMS5]
MGQTLLITDDPGRSADLVGGLDPGLAYRVHDLRDEADPAEAAAVLVTDVADLGAANVERLRQLLARTRRGTPLVVLQRQDTLQARLQALALGASRTVRAPFDLGRLRRALGAAEDRAETVPAEARRRAEAVRAFYGSVFVAGGPVTPVVVDNGTDLVAQAVQETGIRDWIRAVRRFDDATHQHCLLVAGLAAAFAASLSLGPCERHRLTKAALLHDVGKIHVPAAILNKPGKLDAAEKAVMRLHPAQGEAMLANQGFEPEFLGVVRSHHEMLDGSGYPDGLVGRAIPDLVRVVTVCDIYGALIERRSYKPPMASEAAYAILQGMMGRLDPALVKAFHPIATAFTPSFPLDT